MPRAYKCDRGEGSKKLSRFVCLIYSQLSRCIGVSLVSPTKVDAHKSLQFNENCLALKINNVD